MISTIFFAFLMMGPPWQDSAIDLQESLEQSPPPWFDPETGHLRTISEFQRVMEPESGTQSESRKTATENFSDTLDYLWDAVGDFGQWLRSLIPNWQIHPYWFWGILVAVILVIAGFTVYVMLKLDALPGRRGGRNRRDAKKRKAATVEDLPFEWSGTALSVSNLLQRARAEHQSGNLRIAMMYLFSFLLLRMDQKELIRLQKGKTNRAYAKELKRSDRSTLSLYQNTMQAFERSFFGHHELTAQEVGGLLEQTEAWS